MMIPQRVRTASIWLRAALLSCFLNLSWGSMIVEILPGSRQCYYVRVPNDRPSLVSGNFDLLDDEADSEVVNAWLEKRTGTNPGDVHTVWRSQRDEDEDIFSLSVDPEGKYGLCFEVMNPDDDAYETGAPFQIGFNLRVTPMSRSLEDAVAGPDTERALDLVQSAGLVVNHWQNLLDHFDYLRTRESTHTIMMHQIRDRVLGWTVVEAILVITMAVGQILYWKRFFETRRYL